MANQYDIKLTTADMRLFGKTKGVKKSGGSVNVAGNLISSLESMDLIGVSSGGNVTSSEVIADVLEIESGVYDLLSLVPASANGYGASNAAELISAVTGITIKKQGVNEYVLGSAGATLSFPGEVLVVISPATTDVVTIRFTDEAISGIVQDSLGNDVQILNALNLDIVSGTLSQNLSLTFPYNESLAGDENNIKLFRYVGGQWVDQVGTLDTGGNVITESTLTLGKFMVGEQIVAPSVDVDLSFDGEVVGAVPAGIVINDVGGNNTRISDEQFTSSPNSVKLTCPDNINAFWHGIEFAPQRAVEIEWQHWRGYSGQHSEANSAVVSLDNGTGTFKFDGSKNLTYFFTAAAQHPLAQILFTPGPGTGHQLVPGAVAEDNAFTKYKIKWLGGDTLEFYVDDVFTGNFFLRDPSIFQAQRLGRWGWVGFNNHEYLDDVKVTFLTPMALTHFVGEINSSGGAGTDLKNRLYNDVADTNYSRANYRTGTTGGEGGTSTESIAGKGYMVVSQTSPASRDIAEYDPATDATATKLTGVGDNPGFRPWKVNKSATDGTDMYFHNRNGDTDTDVWNKYDVAGNSMSAAAVIPVLVRQPDFGNGKNNMIRWFGGYPTSAQNYEYDSGLNTWTGKTAASWSGNLGIDNSTIDSDGSKMYALTAGALASPSKTLFEYDEDGDSWAMKAAHTQDAWSGFAAAKRVGNNIFYIGGQRGGVGIGPAQSKKYNISSNTWAALANMSDNSYAHNSHGSFSV